MRSRETMTPRQACAELQICNKTLGRWVEQGHLPVAFFTVGGHARYNRSTIESFKAQRVCGVPEPRSDRLAAAEPVVEPDPPASPKPHGLTILTSHEPRRSPGEPLLSKIEAARRPAERGAKAQQHLSELYDAAIRELLGLSRGELFSYVWKHPINRVASALGVTGEWLREICSTHGVPMPPRGYWAIKPERRSVRVIGE